MEFICRYMNFHWITWNKDLNVLEKIANSETISVTYRKSNLVLVVQ